MCLNIIKLVPSGPCVLEGFLFLTTTANSLHVKDEVIIKLDEIHWQKESAQLDGSFFSAFRTTELP